MPTTVTTTCKVNVYGKGTDHVKVFSVFIKTSLDKRTHRCGADQRSFTSGWFGCLHCHLIIPILSGVLK